METCLLYLTQTNLMAKVNVTSSKGVTTECYQNEYGITPHYKMGGSYPCTNYNTAGNNRANDGCMCVDVMKPNSGKVSGYVHNGNGKDCPRTDSDWPNGEIGRNCHLAVWLL